MIESVTKITSAEKNGIIVIVLGVLTILLACLLIRYSLIQVTELYPLTKNITGETVDFDVEQIRKYEEMERARR